MAERQAQLELAGRFSSSQIERLVYVILGFLHLCLHDRGSYDGECQEWGMNEAMQSRLATVPTCLKPLVQFRSSEGIVDYYSH